MVLRVLIIHPSSIMQAAMRRLIDRPGQVLVTGLAPDVDAACELIRSPDHHYDVILIEMTHARSEGAVAKLVEMGDAKVIVMSPTDAPAQVDLWIREGARGVLGPVADPEQLFKAMVKVHEGEFWLNRQMTSRILSGINNPARELTPEEARINRLTNKERIVIRAILSGQGQTLRNTAKSLEISEHTLRNHLTSIYTKLEVANRLELFVFAQRYFSG
jgi:DNA-binding NarL/FixJ family response regulator